MPGPGDLQPRQLWAHATTTTAKPHCTPIPLPKAGIIVFNDSLSITLSRNAVFQPSCTGNGRDPFYASVSPQIFALAVATVISYVLVIMLFITPRTFFVGGPGGGSGFLARRGLIGGSYSNSAIIGVGRRPWLQKIAAVSVAISLTIATADTFKVAERQYDAGISDSAALVDEVTSSLEIRTIQVISDTFLWLAQVQTLIRLFPRHKEKVAIKWLGFALITLDTIFSILNNFVYEVARTRPRSFQDAIPALTYLFELAIGFIYASCIIYYSISKRRFAFFHPKMRNICLVALMSITAVILPVVFFVLDMSKPDVAGWGDYMRWVGAAAASVVVWEWVERIEALERDERKDGILGREVFDGDEMLDLPSSKDAKTGRGADEKGSNRIKTSSVSTWRPLIPRVPFHRRGDPPPTDLPPPQQGADSSDNPVQDQPTPPPAAITPVSRADTTSAASTQYAVRYHSNRTPSPPVPPSLIPGLQRISQDRPPEESASSRSRHSSIDAEKGVQSFEARPNEQWVRFGQNVLRAVPNPFKRRKASPPAEVAGAMRDQSSGEATPITNRSEGSGWNVALKFDAFATAQRNKLRSHGQGDSSNIPSLPVTVIPAQPRGQRTWSPEDFASSGLQQDPETLVQAVSPSSTLPVTVIAAPPRWQYREASATNSGDSVRSGSITLDQERRNPVETTVGVPVTDLGRQIVSRRGTLTISEDGPRRIPGGSLRMSPYARSQGLNPSQSIVSPTNSRAEPITSQHPRELAPESTSAAERPLENTIVDQAASSEQSMSAETHFDGRPS